MPAIRRDLEDLAVVVVCKTLFETVLEFFD